MARSCSACCSMHSRSVLDHRIPLFAIVDVIPLAPSGHSGARMAFVASAPQALHAQKHRAVGAARGLRLVPWSLLDTAAVPGGDAELRLLRRGAEFSIMLGRN